MKILAILSLLASFWSCNTNNPNGSKERPPISATTTVIADSTDKALVLDKIDRSRQTAITKAAEHVSPAVVSIAVTEVVKGQRGYSLFYGYYKQADKELKSVGSGFIISEDGIVVTNQHVVGDNPSKIVVTLSDGNTYDAEMIGRDQLSDICVLKIMNNKSFPYLKFGNSSDIMVGEWAIAVGNPFGLFSDGQATVTVGVVSGKNRDFQPDPNDPRIYVDMIQTDAAINRGNSGGPLVNALGEVIGVNTFIFTGNSHSSGFVGLGFAIPSDRAQKIIDQIINEGEVSLPFDLGMEFKAIDRQTAYRYNIPIQGLLVMSLERDGIAYKNGVQPGDVILAINKKRTVGFPYAQALLREHDPTQPLELIIYRSGEQIALSIPLQ